MSDRINDVKIHTEKLHDSNISIFTGHNSEEDAKQIFIIDTFDTAPILTRFPMKGL